MPSFFFHVRQGKYFDLDEEGLDLPDADVAYSAGLSALHELRDDLAVEGFSDWTLEIADAAGVTILRLSVDGLFPLALPIPKPLDQCPDVLPN